MLVLHVTEREDGKLHAGQSTFLRSLGNPTMERTCVVCRVALAIGCYKKD